MILTQMLKNAVLQAAMQGKLTKQLESDSSVDEILEIIREEKNQLIKMNKKIKGKVLPIIQDDIPFEIPSNWRWVRLGEIGTLTRGNGIKRNEVTENGFPCIRYGELYTTYKTKFETTVSFISKELFEKSQKVNKNDILMTLTGENNFDIALALAYVGNETVAMGGDLTKWSNHHMEPLYLVYVMNSSYAIHKKSEMAKGDIIVHISNDKLSTIMLPIPPLEEQKRIVNKVNEIMEKIDDYKKVEKELLILEKRFPVNIKNALLQAAIQGKLTEQLDTDGNSDDLFTSIQAEKDRLIKEGVITKHKKLKEIEDEEIEFGIPSNWRWVRLLDICEYIQRGKSPKYSQIKKYPVIAQKCNQWSGFDISKAQFIEPDTLSSYKKERILQDNDLLWNSTGLGTLGRMVLYKTSYNPYELAVADSHVTVIRPIKGLINPMYLFYYFTNPTVQFVIEDKANGSTKQKELAVDTVKNYIVPLPPLEEQNRIVDKLDKLVPLCTDVG